MNTCTYSLTRDRRDSVTEYGCFRVDKLYIVAVPVEGANDKLIWETGNSSQTGTEEGRIAGRNAFRNAIFVVDVCNKLIVTNKSFIKYMTFDLLRLLALCESIKIQYGRILSHLILLTNVQSFMKVDSVKNAKSK